MDEWLSLTEEGKMSDTAPRKTDESDILFDLHKVDSICDDNEEIIKIGPFLEVYLFHHIKHPILNICFSRNVLFVLIFSKHIFV